MGIKNLLPFLQGAQRDVHLASFRGKTAAVDAYCWLHRGAYSCPFELQLAKKEKIQNLPLLNFCMKRVNLLRQYDINPILVFDGANLPMKHDTEKERKERRDSYRKQGKALLKEGKEAEARECFQRCVEISPEIASAFINLLYKEKVEVIVAPYEADAQLAYLVKEGLADFVITEDSDLLAFGVSQVFFKMNDTGHGKLMELRDIAKGNPSLKGFTPDSFRHLCILCGCDYLPSVHGIGPVTAAKLMKKCNKDPYKVIRYLKSGSKHKVPPGYEEHFRQADQAFLYQLVFDPRSQSQVRLNTPPPDVEKLEYAGIFNSPSKQVGLARGNINPLTLEEMDQHSPKCKKGAAFTSLQRHSSWSGSVLSRSGSISRQTTLLPVSQEAKKDFKKCRTLKRASPDEDDALSMDDLKLLYSEKMNNSQSEEEVRGTVQVSSRNVFSKVTVKSKYFASSTSNVDSLSCLDALAQNETQNIVNEKEPSSSSVDSGLGNELDENEKENIESDNHEIESDSSQDDEKDINISDDNDDKEEINDIRTFAVDEVSEILTSDEGLNSKSQHSKRKLFTSETIETKRPKLSASTSIDVPDTPTDTEDCFIVKSSPSTLKCKASPLPFRLGLSRKATPNAKSSFKSPRLATGSSSSSLLSYFSYKQKDKL
ncbi:PREDICTED: exonuclease 1-like [Amphimedon queenslandica]|uniref:Exonuclease 1 n=1 Tax=Amphimedon queenslandica TaxID=400682 RepID=A0A1X7V4T2_AMPQE|nr:PREDICTED: exonuclease 1-like [Amphimedon queenslandica]|eukprot:XP_019850771.1 PREDICTED: exonuclease 1-like [Amphimedon queenslandica]